MSDRVDSETFIHEIEKYPELWNVHCKEYKSRLKKLNAWDSICAAIYDDFECKTWTEKRLLRGKVITRWKHIKDAYIRALKNENEYIYGRYLEFFKPMIPSARIRTNIKDFNNELSQTYSVESSEEQNVLEEDFTVDVPPLNHFTVDEPPLNHPSPVPERRDIIEKAAVNDHQAFFDSLLPTINNFDDDQTYEFRSEMLRIVQRIRKKTPSEYYSQPASLTSFPPYLGHGQSQWVLLYPNNNYDRQSVSSEPYFMKEE